jgi:hypothetical protein
MLGRRGVEFVDDEQELHDAVAKGRVFLDRTRKQRLNLDLLAVTLESLGNFWLAIGKLACILQFLRCQRHGEMGKVLDLDYFILLQVNERNDGLIGFVTIVGDQDFSHSSRPPSRPFVRVFRRDYFIVHQVDFVLNIEDIVFGASRFLGQEPLFLVRQ